MITKKYLEFSIVYDMLFAYDTCESKVYVLNGENNIKDTHLIIKSSDNNISLNNLEKTNYLSNEKYATKIKNIFYELNEISKSSNIKFAGNAIFKTSCIQIINTIEDYRCDGSVRISLTNTANMIVYSDIPFFHDTTEMVNTIKKEYFLLLKEVCTTNVEYVTLQNNKYDIVLSSKSSAYLIHEILGHMLEADYIFNSASIFSKYKIGDKILKQNVSMYDDPTVLSNYHIGVGKYDDEGELIKPVHLIKQGLLNEYILTGEYSKKMNLAATIGCSRRQSYKHNSIPRMRNTFLCNNEKTNINYEYMKKNVDTSIFVDSIFSGAINPLTGDFILNCSKGIYVKGGKELGRTGNISISDNIFNAINNIDVIGNDLNFYIGKCVKSGQVVTVGMGSPSIKINNLQTIVGGIS
jgi:predicted Zn-dependent protease